MHADFCIENGHNFDIFNKRALETIQVELDRCARGTLTYYYITVITQRFQIQ